MQCRNCQFLSGPKTFQEGHYPSVRCTLGQWDKEGHEVWYSWGETQLNRGPVRRLGAACTQGIELVPLTK
jgi:hypothetical protein